MTGPRFTQSTLSQYPDDGLSSRVLIKANLRANQESFELVNLPWTRVYDEKSFTLKL
jgi:hypothetical protein